MVTTIHHRNNYYDLDNKNITKVTLDVATIQKVYILLSSITPPVFPSFWELSPLMDLASILPRGSLRFLGNVGIRRIPLLHDITQDKRLSYILSVIIAMMVIMAMSLHNRDTMFLSYLFGISN